MPPPIPMAELTSDSFLKKWLLWKYTAVSRTKPGYIDWNDLNLKDYDIIGKAQESVV